MALQVGPRDTAHCIDFERRKPKGRKGTKGTKNNKEEKQKNNSLFCFSFQAVTPVQEQPHRRIVGGAASHVDLFPEFRSCFVIASILWWSQIFRKSQTLTKIMQSKVKLYYLKPSEKAKYQNLGSFTVPVFWRSFDGAARTSRYILYIIRIFVPKRDFPLSIIPKKAPISTDSPPGLCHPSHREPPSVGGCECYSGYIIWSLWIWKISEGKWRLLPLRLLRTLLLSKGGGWRWGFQHRRCLDSFWVDEGLRLLRQEALGPSQYPKSSSTAPSVLGVSREIEDD